MASENEQNNFINEKSCDQSFNEQANDDNRRQPKEESPAEKNIVDSDKIIKKNDCELLEQHLDDCGAVVQTPKEETNLSDDNTDENVNSPKKNWKKVIGKIINWALIVAIVVLIGINVVKIFFLSEVEVSGDSMKPTFSTGDKVLVNKTIKPSTSDIVVVYKYDIDSKIKAYFAPAKYRVSNGKYAMLIKRAVAIAGDTISVDLIDGKYYLKILKDGKWLYEFYCWDYYCSEEYANRLSGKYVLAESLSQAQEYGVYVEQLYMTSSDIGILVNYVDCSYVLTDNQILVIGDNRRVSSDSRQNGFSSYSRLLGVVVKTNYQTKTSK